MSRTPLFAVYDWVELLALSRLILDAKFQTESRDQDLWGSPYVSTLASRVDEALINAYEGENKDKFVSNHLRWRDSLPQNAFVLAAIRARLKEISLSPWWKEQSPESKLVFLRGVVVPYQPDDEFLQGLINEVEV